MYFEPANKEKKKIPVWIPLILLFIWMIGSSWYWMCGVKGMCTGSSVLNEASSLIENKP